MTTQLLDNEMRRALEPWDGVWSPVSGLLKVHQHTASQLLNAGSKGSVCLNNAEACFLQIVQKQDGPLSRIQRNWLDRLAASYDAVGGEVMA